jgi:hypothetical protein
MPAASAWLDRLPSLIEKVTDDPRPVYDRRALQTLFDVKPRRAQQLLRELAAAAGESAPARAGQAHALPRAVLLRALHAIAGSDEFQQHAESRSEAEARMKERVTAAAAARVRIPVSAGRETRSLASLPPGIRLERGRLEISFDDAEDLWWQLGELIAAAAHDNTAFRAFVEPEAADGV